MLTGTTTSPDDPGAAAPGEPRSFRRQFASSPLGARLARHLAVRCLEEWGYPPDSDVSCTMALVVGELAANAVRHGRVPGHDFSLGLGLHEAADTLRIEVADAATAKRPPESPPTSPPEGESGRGLFLVDLLSARWGTEPRDPVGKTVWAELDTSAAPADPPTGC
ncbi:ATP-binding protein [Streptomyces sp. NPDC093586]|uniref:ATP-binding protein n=1 Tax=Streptomyces sp. NPDC093586 TaxID=3366042 RepID=UPI0037F352B0